MIATRVVHIPGRTPYARKLHDEGIQVLNATTVAGTAVPQDVTLAWLLVHRPWDWLDVVHLHHPDFEPVSCLRAVLAECRRVGKRMLFTVHDLDPIFGDSAKHNRRLRILAENGVPFVCPTPAAESISRRRFGADTVMIPHGYVAVPGTHARQVPREPGPTRFLIYGSLRRNRDVELVLACWRFARHLRETTLHLLLRAPSRASLAEDSEVWRMIRETAVDPRLRVEVLPFPTDHDVDEAVAGTDSLLLPYRWASHSGQLEHAADLGVLPVVSRTGFLPDQSELHVELADEPIWFDWSDGAVFDYGARLLEAMQNAHTAIQDGWRSRHIERFADHRRQEHAEILNAYRALCDGGR